VPEQLGAPLVDVVAGRHALVRLPADLASGAAHLVDGADELRAPLRIGDGLAEALEQRSLEVVHARAEDQALRREPEPEAGALAARAGALREPEVEMRLVRPLVPREAGVAIGCA
jgi:hypothetical protein